MLLRSVTAGLLTATLAAGLSAPGVAQCMDPGSSGSGGSSASTPSTAGPSFPSAAGPTLAAPSSGGGAGATTGVSQPASAPTTGAGVTPRGRGRREPGCAASTQGQALVVTEEPWSRWWNRHQDEYVWGRDRHGRLSSAPIVSGSGAREARAERAGQRPLRRGYVYTQVVGPLLEVIAGDDDAALRETAILALGEAVDERFAAVVTEALLPSLEDADLRVRSAAALALGLAGDPQAVPLLTDLAACSQRGHQLVGGGEVSQRVRTAALLGLGYSAAPEALPTLSAILAALPDSQFEMKRAAIMAMGLMDNERAPQAAAQLAELLVDRKLDQLIKAAVPTALARLGQRSSAAALRAVLADRDTDRVVRQSCVIALGRLGSLGDVGLVDELVELAVGDRDEATRNFATVALAQLGVRAGGSEATQEFAEQHDQLMRTFVRQLKRPEHRGDRPFFALASGLYMASRRSARDELAPPLRDAYEHVSNPAVKGAYALALGLAGERDTGRALRADFLDSKDPVFRSHCAVALGLLGYGEADADLRALVTEKGLQPYLTRSLGTALMLLDDPRARGELVAGFEAARSFEHRAGLAQALSAQRHEDVVPALRAALGDHDLDQASRASACAALGWVAGRDRLPWRAQLSVGSNFVAVSPTVDDVLGMP